MTLTPGARVLAQGHQRTYAGTVLGVQADGYAVVKLDVDRDSTRILVEALTVHRGSTSGST